MEPASSNKNTRSAVHSRADQWIVVERSDARREQDDTRDPAIAVYPGRSLDA
jgi:hypothetical protein